MKLGQERLSDPLVPALLFVIAILFFPALVFSQPARQYTVSGYIKDAGSGETLLNATISVSPAGIVTQSNTYGFFSVSVAAGKYTLSFSYTGYAVLQKEITVDK